MPIAFEFHAEYEAEGKDTYSPVSCWREILKLLDGQLLSYLTKI